MKNLKLADSSNTDTKSVNILIGLDYYYLFVTGDIIRGEPNEPIVLNSIFGWILCGTFVEATQANFNVTHLFRVDTLPNKTGGITKEGNLFEFDITYDTRVQMFPNEDHKHIFEDFENNIQFKNNRYITKLPIRKTDDILPDNYILANNRLINLEKQLDRNKKRFVDYDKIIRDYIKVGIVEQIDHFDNNAILGRVHYLPHRGVVREDHDTTKLRIVFDASAKIRNELSLNDILYSGPGLLPYLYDILLRFRTGKIGLVGDIKQAFLQVEIAEEHRDFFRFLWFKDINETPRKIISLRLTRVVFGLTSSPFLLNGTIKIHVSKYLPVPHYTDIVKKLLLNLYVDDSTNSFDTIETAIKFYEKSKSCLKEANFELRKWAKNSFEMKKLIDSNESPITLQPKFIFQELCRSKLEWDEVINDRNNMKKWTKFLYDLGQFRLINAPRHVLCCEGRDVKLHGFSDSSGKAYGACVLVWVICEHGGSVRLWTSKCRLASLKELSIPRLELMACLLLSRLMVSVKLAVEKEVSVKNIFCGTNSQIALWWIRQRHKKWKIGVQNRAEALRQNVNVENWGFVPTSLNRADICTRECPVGKLKSCLLWWNRPEFLLGGKEMWPSQEFLLPKNVDLEEKGSKEVVSSVNVNFSGCEVGIGKVIDCGRFSSLNKLVRVTAFVLRYVHNLKAFLSGCEVTKGDLLFEEIEKSKLVWVKYEQYFIKNPENYTKLKNSLNLFINSQDVIRCRSRVAEANQLKFNEKCPILLRNDSIFTSLVVLKCHHTFIIVEYKQPYVICGIIIG